MIARTASPRAWIGLLALLAFAILRDAFALGTRIAAALAALVAVGPEQLFHERMVRAEAAGLLAAISGGGGRSRIAMTRN